MLSEGRSIPGEKHRKIWRRSIYALTKKLALNIGKITGEIEINSGEGERRARGIDGEAGAAR